MYEDIFKIWEEYYLKKNSAGGSESISKIKEYLQILEDKKTKVNDEVTLEVLNEKISNIKFILKRLEKLCEGANNIIDNGVEESHTLEDVNENIKAVNSSIIETKTCESKPKYLIIRILQSIPTIVGADLNVYGPFNPEDIAAIPEKNARNLIEKGVAVEVKWGSSNENGSKS
ncbi:MAG: DNA replication complex subunit Gins51 [Candidatus Odinarchaeia archaeon]